MTTSSKVFAQDRERTPEGWLVYGRDKTLRESYYSGELLERIMTHPAKMNAYLCRDIVDYVSEPGQMILDPFGGAGTTLLAAPMGRNVTLIEIEEYYFKIIQDSIKALMKAGVDSTMIPIMADNRRAMPIPCDHIITSPPYGNDLFKEKGAIDDSSGTNANEMKQYGNSFQNIGRLNPFLYEQQMKRVYSLMVDSVRPGGTITITHRDRLRGEQRILYIDSIVGTLVKLGMRVRMLDKWKAPGSIQSRINEKNGVESILDEDVICMEKPL